MITATTLEEIVIELYNISGFRIAIFDTDRKELFAYPREISTFCSLVQSDPNALALCRKYDHKAFDQAEKNREAYIYHCHFGLYEAVAPLYDFDILSGYLMMGQTLESIKSSRNEVFFKAEHYIKDKELLNLAINQLSEHSKGQILSCISIMKVCASYITLSNRLKAKQDNLPTTVKYYIREHFEKDISLEHLCTHFYCSRATLTNSFRQVFGKSIHQYLTEVRLEHAMKLLQNHALSINSIAYECGFHDQNYFTKAFKKHQGITPTYYRQISNSSICDRP